MSCADLIRRRCRESEQEPSLYLIWLRDRFSQVGKQHQLLGVQSEAEGVELIEVEIGANRFMLFHDATPFPPGGLVVDVSKVNGKRIAYYLKDK